jgi:hypothetical protein
MSILGKWQQPKGQPFPGLWFEFNADGTFRAEFPEMGIISSGTYQVAGDQLDLDQTQHSFGMVGKFKGLWVVEGSVLKMAVGQPNENRPPDLKAARSYEKIG